jgi:hypothetical protein
MTITVSGRALLLLTTGLWICLAGPSPYAANAATDVPGAHHLKKSTHHASSDDANKSADAKKADDNDDGAAPASSADLPPSVANANAQLAAADSANGNPVASDRTLNSPQAVFGPPPVIGTTAAPAQLSDADRAAATAAPPPVAVAAADSAPIATVGTAATSSDSSTWDKTSLIGKIFVGCGALLTMASALRMFWV